MSMRRYSLATMVAVAAGLALAACSDDGMKYYEGPDDPALKATSRDIAEVHKLLEEQKEKEVAAGLRPAGPVRVADGDPLPEGHPTLEASPAPAAPSPGGRVNLEVLEGELPEGWKTQQPEVAMRLAEIVIPAAQGDAEPGVIAVFPSIGGGVEANLDRWYGQITQPDGRPTKETAKVEFITADSDLDVIFVDAAGTYDGSTMMTPMEPKENWRLLAGIVKTPEGLVFLKGAGPEKTMTENREAMAGFLRSLRLPGAPSPAPAAPIPQRVESHGTIETGASAAPASGERLDLQVVTGSLPAGWTSKPPSSSMRVAEIVLPPAAGDGEAGELVAFYFGPGQGGSVEENLQRWLSQMENGDEPRREKFFVGGMPVTTIDAGGTYSAISMRPGEPAPGPKANWRLLGAIVETPRGSLFIRATGPDPTMRHQRDAFRKFLESLEPRL
jgi:hypothetical protein